MDGENEIEDVFKSDKFWMNFLVWIAFGNKDDVSKFLNIKDKEENDEPKENEVI